MDTLTALVRTLIVNGNMEFLWWQKHLRRKWEEFQLLLGGGFHKLKISIAIKDTKAIFNNRRSIHSQNNSTRIKGMMMAMIVTIDMMNMRKDRIRGKKKRSRMREKKKRRLRGNRRKKI